MKKAIFFLVLLPFLSCKDEPEATPSYLRLKPFAVSALGGAAWQDLSEGWLYVNGEFLGAYTLPSVVPVLASGDSEVILFPGVKENGITETPNIYFFLKRFDQNATLKPGEVVDIQPQTSYADNVTGPWDVNRASFDGSATVVLENRDDDAVNTFKLTTEGAFAGKCVLMELDSLHPLMSIATEQAELPVSREREVWLELHYRADLPFDLWLIGRDIFSGLETGQPVFRFNKSETWNKTYLNLTQFLVGDPKDNYRLNFRALLTKDNNGKWAQPNGAVRLDNIRLFHFN
jgi:hypothetical protein